MSSYSQTCVFIYVLSLSFNICGVLLIEFQIIENKPTYPVLTSNTAENHLNIYVRIWKNYTWSWENFSQTLVY